MEMDLLRIQYETTKSHPKEILRDAGVGKVVSVHCSLQYQSRAACYYYFSHIFDEQYPNFVF